MKNRKKKPKDKFAAAQLDTREKRIKREAMCFVCCTAGALVMAFNLKSFVNTGNLFPGGFAGVTLLILRSCEKYFGLILPYSAIYIPLNMIPIYIGIKYLGKRFTIYSIYVIVLSSIMEFERTGSQKVRPWLMRRLLICR